jgi:hypothetical protein
MVHGTDRIVRRVCGVAAITIVALSPCMARASSGLFNLALLAENRQDIDAIHDATGLAVSRLTRGTAFANKWTLNQTDTDSTTLRIVLFRSTPTTDGNEVTKDYTDSCNTFIPFKLIICDVHAFEVLMHRWGFDRVTKLGRRDWPVGVDVPVRQLTREEQRETLLELVTWVLGHEIGHVTQRGGEQVADVASLLSDAPSRRLTQTSEVLADEHVLHGSGLNDPERSDLDGFWNAALNAELRLKYCPGRDVIQACSALPAGVGIIYDYNSGNPLEIDASEDHPEFLLRLIRMMELQHSRGDCQSDGLCFVLKAVLRQVKPVKQH